MTRKNMTLRTDGFVRNIHSRNPFDVIRADVVLARMEKQAIGVRYFRMRDYSNLDHANILARVKEEIALRQK